MHNEYTGKLAFLKNLGLINKEDRRFILSLSELRNTLVHNVKSSNFKFSDYASNIADANLKATILSFSPTELSLQRINKLIKDHKITGFTPLETRTNVEIFEVFKDDPRFYILAEAYNVFRNLNDMYGYSEYMQWIKQGSASS